MKRNLIAARKQASQCAAALLAGFVFLCVCLVCAPRLWAATPDKRVLFVSSYNYAFPSVPQQIEGIAAALTGKATLEYLFMDTRDLPDDASAQLFYTVCKNKLEKSAPFDVLIVGDDAALNFALAHRDDLFGDIPLVFEGVNDAARAELTARDAHTTGVLELPPYTENIQTALTLRPKATKIVGIVDNTATGISDAALFLAQQKIFSQLEFSLLVSSDFTQEALCEALAAIGEDTLLFSFSMNLAADGTVYPLSQQMAIVREHTRVPVFRMAEPGMGDGFLGGKMISFVDMGRMAGEMAARILAGEDVRDIPPVLNTPTRYYYDYAVMEQYAITRDALHSSAVFVNDPHSEITRLRPVFTGAALLLGLLAIGVAFVLRDNRRHRETAKALRTTTANLAYTAHFDALTGVYRRVYFFERTQELLEANLDDVYVIFRTDIQRFRVVNDLYGSSTGDHVLVEFGRLLREYVGENGTCARFQADNFLGCVRRAYFDPHALLHHLDATLHELVPGHEIIVNLGLYEIDDISLSVSLMCDRANIALQRIKSSVVNRCAWYDVSLRNQMLEEQSLVSNMKDALTRGEFKVYYQPIYDLVTQLPISAEALVRWQHPTRGMVSPGVFIPLFERNGSISKIDAFVCKRVCMHLRQRLDAAQHVVPVSLNLSRVNFGSDRLYEGIVATSEQFRISNGLLKLEITESAYTENRQQIMEETELLRRRGFPILMDDFGSGYSSLNMLKDMPVDVLKLDMGFLREFQESNRTQIIMRCVVDMAKNLGMGVIAEGVETLEQVNFLRSIGCDAAQGYYYARPMPEDEFCALLDSVQEG